MIAVADQERLKNELRQVHRVTASEEAVDLYPGCERPPLPNHQRSLARR